MGTEPTFLILCLSHIGLIQCLGGGGSPFCGKSWSQNKNQLPGSRGVSGSHSGLKQTLPFTSLLGPGGGGGQANPSEGTECAGKGESSIAHCKFQLECRPQALPASSASLVGGVHAWGEGPSGAPPPPQKQQAIKPRGPGDFGPWFAAILH